jgi:hypothetical protein
MLKQIAKLEKFIKKGAETKMFLSRYKYSTVKNRDFCNI